MSAALNAGLEVTALHNHFFFDRPKVYFMHLGGQGPGPLTGLTERERQVLALVAEGLSNDEIAGRLFLSPLTSKTHVSRIMTKLNARDRAQLVVMAYESGLVTPGGRRPA